MSLQAILTDIASELHIPLNTDDEISWAVSKVNAVAKELYEGQDITGCLREQTFNLDTDTKESSLVALPFYVDQLRGIRFSMLPGGKIPMNDMRPRYHTGRGWGANAYSVPFRITREQATLKRDIANASVLTFSVAEAEPTDIIIHIVGETNNAARYSESVTLSAGELSVDSVGNYITTPVNLEKETVSQQDITISDVDGNELAVIPNFELKPAYKWLELVDANAGVSSFLPTYTSFTAIDILYKLRYQPFRDAFDEFICGPKFDRAIFYQFAAWYEGQKPGSENRAMGYLQAAQTIIANIQRDTEGAREMEIEFGRNGYESCQQPFRWYANFLPGQRRY